MRTCCRRTKPATCPDSCSSRLFTLSPSARSSLHSASFPRYTQRHFSKLLRASRGSCSRRCDTYTMSKASLTETSRRTTYCSVAAGGSSSPTLASQYGKMTNRLARCTLRSAQGAFALLSPTHCTSSRDKDVDQQGIQSAGALVRSESVRCAGYRSVGGRCDAGRDVYSFR